MDALTRAGLVVLAGGAAACGRSFDSLEITAPASISEAVRNGPGRDPAPTGSSSSCATTATR